MKFFIVVALALVGSYSLAQQETLPLIHCDVSGQSIELEVTPIARLEFGFQKSLSFNDDLFILSTNNRMIGIQLVHKQNQKSGPNYFSATYSHFEGAKKDGGFTGRVILRPHGTSQPYVAFLCYEKIY